MFDIVSFAAIHLKKFKVIHKLPGRLRIKVPNMNKATKDAISYEKYLTEAINILPGIKEVTYNYISGNILLTYDIKVTCEKQVLSWLDKIWEISIKNRKFIEEHAINNIDYVADNIRYQLKKEVDNI
ncbi:HMA2 domain-containing protein [Tepidibacter hydrothermalis]|uniref:Cation transporter n=1 Tax=Tepidibacter hydrothermalis TaxID=3036126 RepID=A0ABY8EEL4_9FIRM|nr:hypothetical protein [Tepidibacter hydrothermalis]WFD09927.1 hypothetical protein P4S50_16340 [Tepidibacter hydrothermalis]